MRFGEYASYDIFIDVEAKGVSDLLSDFHAAEFGVTALQLYDCCNELLLEQQGFCSDGTHAAGTEELCDGYEQVSRQKERIARELHVITLAHLRNTASRGLFALHFYEFAKHG